MRHPGTEVRSARNILIVDDERGLARLMGAALRSQGYTCLAAFDPLEALNVANQFPETIHLLVTDYLMPVMSGLELIQRFAVLRPGMKVVLVTGYAPTSVPKEIPVLKKPFTVDELIAIVSGCLST